MILGTTESVSGCGVRAAPSNPSKSRVGPTTPPAKQKPRVLRVQEDGTGEELLASDPAATWCQTRQRRPTHPPCESRERGEKERRVLSSPPGRPLIPHRSRPPVPSVRHQQQMAGAAPARTFGAAPDGAPHPPASVVVGPTRDFDGAARTPQPQSRAVAVPSPHALSFSRPGSPHPHAFPFIFSTARRRRRQRTNHSATGSVA